MEQDPNYCHDDEIKNTAGILGLSLLGRLINRALSKGEGMYNAQDAAEAMLQDHADKIRRNKLKQLKTRLSRKQKKAILKRNGQ